MTAPDAQAAGAPDGPKAKPGPLYGWPDDPPSGGRAPGDAANGGADADGFLDEGAGAMLLAELLDATRRLEEGSISESRYEDRLRLLWSRWLDRVRSEGEAGGRV